MIKRICAYLWSEKKIAPVESKGWSQTRDFNMRMIERDFMNGADVRSVCDWAIEVGQHYGDGAYATWAKTLKDACQVAIDSGKSQPNAKPEPRPLSHDEIRHIRDRYR